MAIPPLPVVLSSHRGMCSCWALGLWCIGSLTGSGEAQPAKPALIIAGKRRVRETENGGHSLHLVFLGLSQLLPLRPRAGCRPFGCAAGCMWHGSGVGGWMSVPAGTVVFTELSAGAEYSQFPGFQGAPWGSAETRVTGLQKRRRRKLLFTSFMANKKLEQ